MQDEPYFARYLGNFVNIAFDGLKSWIVQQVSDIGGASGQKVIEAHHLEVHGQQPFTQVKARNPAPPVMNARRDPWA